MNDTENLVMSNTELTALVHSMQERLCALEDKPPVHVPAPVYGSAK